MKHSNNRANYKNWGTTGTMNKKEQKLIHNIDKTFETKLITEQMNRTKITIR